jgi:hypothetical protein
VALAALQARMISAKNDRKALLKVGLTSCRVPARHSAGWGLILVWMKCRPADQSDSMGDL